MIAAGRGSFGINVDVRGSLGAGRAGGVISRRGFKTSPRREGAAPAILIGALGVMKVSFDILINIYGETIWQQSE